MARLNIPCAPIRTHEGAIAQRINPELQLRRSVMACMLWEKTFYEDGIDIAQRIQQTIPLVAPDQAATIAIEAREAMKLRHAPLLIVREMARTPNHKRLVASTLARIIQRPDELAEFMALYWADGKAPLSAQVKRGLAQAFTKFNAYQLAKYNRDDAAKLRDVLFLCHAKPKDTEQEATWKKLINGELEAPDTWEVALSAGANKGETFSRLISERKLGALALLRNLRNMQQANVSDSLIRSAIADMDTSRVLPFRFIAAARYAPSLEDALEQVFMKCASDLPSLDGTTVVLVDVSGSMDAPLSAKSDMNRIDAGCGVAMVAREMCARARIFTFSQGLVEIPPRRGFALRDAIVSSQSHASTYLGQAVRQINGNVPHDRLVVITDEQSHDSVPAPKAKGYMINVAAYKNGVGYGSWAHFDGFSEAILNYIREIEELPRG